MNPAFKTHCSFMYSVNHLPRDSGVNFCHPDLLLSDCLNVSTISNWTFLVKTYKNNNSYLLAGHRKKTVFFFKNMIRINLRLKDIIICVLKIC